MRLCLHVCTCVCVRVYISISIYIYIYIYVRACVWGVCVCACGGNPSEHQKGINEYKLFIPDQATFRPRRWGQRNERDASGLTFGVPSLAPWFLLVLFFVCPVAAVPTQLFAECLGLRLARPGSPMAFAESPQLQIHNIQPMPTQDRLPARIIAQWNTAIPPRTRFLPMTAQCGP